MKQYSYAKINLLLEVISKRRDGFHEIQSIMQTVSLCDEVLVELSNVEGIHFSCFPDDICENRHNLVYKAASVFYENLKEKAAVNIRLVKKIPLGAGLGGGSSNAAVTLKILNKLHNEPFKKREILKMAEVLGSDVPFFVDGGTSLAFGRGEKILNLPDIGGYQVLLLNPGFSIETKLVYAHHKLGLTSRQCIPNILPVLMAGRMSGKDLIKHVHNDLQFTVLGLFPELKESLNWIAGQKPEASGVSGSGATVFGLFSDEQRATEAAIKAENLFSWVSLTKTVVRYE
jgi:4-diphosphocytidyl-2-C-methyl-D-erythritol kinase